MRITPAFPLRIFGFSGWLPMVNISTIPGFYYFRCYCRAFTALHTHPEDVQSRHFPSSVSITERTGVYLKSGSWSS